MAMHTKDQCWHLTVVTSVAYGLLSVLTTNSGFMYVGIMEQFNVNREMASWPVSILFIAIQTAGIGVGLLENQLSMLKIGVLTSVLIWASVLCSVFVTSVTWMSITYGGLHGVGVGGFTVVSLYITMAYFDKYKGTASGIVHLGDCVFGLFAPKFLVFLQQEYGFRGALLVHSAVAMNITPLSFFFRDPPRKEAEKIEAYLPTITDTPVSKSYSTFAVKPQAKVVERKDGNLARRARMTFGKPVFYVVILSYVTLHFAQPLFLTTVIDFAMDRGATLVEASTILTFLAPVEIVARLCLPMLGDKINMRSSVLIFWCFLMAGGGFLALPQSQSYVFLVSVSICIAMLQGLIMTMKPVLVTDYVGLENLSFTFGLAGVGVIPLMLGTPSFIGYYRDHIGAYDNMYRVLGGIHVLLSLIILPVVCKELRHKKQYQITH